MSKGELACVYASLMLADDDISITADKINTIIKAANIRFVEPYLPTLFANALNGRNIKDLLMSVGAPAAGAAAPAAPVTTAATADAPAAPAKEEKKDEKAEESDDSMGFDLFG